MALIEWIDSKGSFWVMFILNCEHNTQQLRVKLWMFCWNDISQAFLPARAVFNIITERPENIAYQSTVKVEIMQEAA